MSWSLMSTMLQRTSFIAVAAAVLLSGGATQAQDHDHVHFVPRTYGSGYYGWSPYSTTWQEGLLHGYSDLLRASGQHEILHNEALRSREAAIEHALENSVRRLEVRQTRQLMGLQHRETQRRLERERRAASITNAQDAEPVDEAAEAERRATNKLQLARNLLDAGRQGAAKKFLEDILRDFSETGAAEEAGRLLAER